MTTTVALECTCGSVKGELTVVPSDLFHVHCLCCDCQRYAQYLNNEAVILDEFGGTELLQTYPAYLSIREGIDKVQAVQLTPKGIYRWHTTCCHMPVANTVKSSAVPFVGVSVKWMKFATEQDKLAALGPVTIKAFGKYAIGAMPDDVHPRFPLVYMPKILGFMLKGKLRGRHRPSPFFNATLPVAEVRQLF
ncbi:DUF6151 family protein [Gilvimarinus agarilyticus]|uniref:DUF6151 family protein n=1 Tax=Gilvimarinus agarilyticus TaxID=679259 RepID=UPI00059F8B5A|nr:DUF6151 family protein [Gilvimarinus agarilyticus]